ncbi:hypothetical protein EV356DRAFT_514040 [Viridothelium virens]|uniref:Mediator of RNA polymerase II transcription subunit 13 n=1 Tax=Viridothelium virens TaxID=1048519 RepID=A0A6A6HQG0_VIRVR|nr:hypothetical protein EV356DRAFT_514040 [Viridothelium virens]
MEIPRKWSTGVYAIDGFSAVHYCTYAITPGRCDPANAGPLLWAAQATLRAHGYFVAPDQKKAALWLFTGSNAVSDSGSEDISTLRAAKDILNRQRQAFECISSGTFHAVDLCQLSNRFTTKSAASNRTPSVGGNINNSSNQESNPIDPLENTYRLFILAISSSISYNLAGHYDMIPLDVRSFFFKSRSLKPDYESPSLFTDLPATSFDIRLSTSGSLLISLIHEAYHRVRFLSGPCLPGSISSRDETSPNPISSPSWARNGGFGVFWRTVVQFWLRSKGITIPNASSAGAWRVISDEDRSQPAVAGGALLPANSASKFSCEWPATLCLGDDGASPDGEIGLLAPQLKLSGESETNSAHVQADRPDSLAFVEEWTLSSNERHKVVEALQLAKRAENENASAQIPMSGPDGSLPSSPIHARASELAGVNAIYPTPPDGFTSQAPTSSSIMVTDHPSEARTEDPIEREEPVVSSDARSNRFSPEIADSASQSAGLQNELFDEMGEDGFEATAVTDPDWSFFDEPEVESMDITFEENRQGSLSRDEPQESLGSRHYQDEIDGKNDSTQGATINQSPVSKHIPVEEAFPESSRSENVNFKSPDASGSAVPLAVEQINERGPLELMTPELSPALVQKRLFQDTVNAEGSIVRHRQPPGETVKNFNPVTFGTSVESFDQKYGDSGRFNFKLGTAASTPARKSATAPTSPLMSRKQRPLDMSETRGAPHPVSTEKYQSEDSTDEGYSSDTDIESYSSHEGPSHLRHSDLTIDENGRPGNKRKRNGNEASPSLQSPQKIVGSEQASFANGEVRSATKQEACCLMRQIDSHFCGATNWFSSNSPGPAISPSPQNSELNQLRTAVLHDKEAVDIVQIVSDEHVHSSLKAASQKTWLAKTVSANKTTMEEMMECALRDVLRKLFPTSRECDLQGLSSIQEGVPESQATKTAQRPVLQRKQTDGPGPYSNSFFRILPPYIKIQRSERLLQILPPAVHFWDTLGLAPFSGPKDLSGYCIYPSNLRTKGALLQFFDCLASTYENRKLGSHKMAENDTNPDLCLFPCDVDINASLIDSIQTIQSTCNAAGKSLAARKLDGKNLVVYLINPFENDAIFASLCQAIWFMFQTYSKPGSASRASHRKSEIIFKILNMHMIPDEESVLDPNSEDLLRLAYEIYERSSSKSSDWPKSGLNIRRGSAVQLAATLPKSIQFKLNADPPADLLEENSFFHLAYSRSPSDQWLTASWTDNIGQHQATATYGLYGRKFEEVAREIWDTTIGILKGKNISWRFIVAKEGLFLPGETEAWTKLFTTAAPIQITTTLISMEVRPYLTITSERLPSTGGADGVTKGHAHTNSNPANVATPISTPTTSATPTDNASAAPSPSTGVDNLLEPGPDSRLIDQTNETWGVVLGTRMHTSAVFGDWSPSLISGLMIKRGNSSQGSDSNPSKRMPCIAVHVSWIGNSVTSSSATGISSASSAPLPSASRNYELLMREVLTMYRGLGTLAKVRFMDDGMGGVLPLHVLTAMRGANALDRCLPV